MKPLGGTRSKLKYKSAPAESNQKPPAGVRRELAGGYGWPRAGRRRASRNGTFPRQVGYVFPTGGPFKDGDEASRCNILSPMAEPKCDCLAVDQARPDLERLHRLDDQGIARRPVVAVARQEPYSDRDRVTARHHAVAVVLDLVDPLRTRRRRVG
jgi:hypothetical protein